MGQEKSTSELITILSDPKGRRDSRKIRQLGNVETACQSSSIIEALVREGLFTLLSSYVFQRLTRSLREQGVYLMKVLGVAVTGEGS